MHRLITILFLFVTGVCFATNKDTSSSRPITNREKANREIAALKNGALIVRLQTNEKSINAYRQAGKNELADKIAAERNGLNQKIVDAFKNYFTFCKVYFIYAKNTGALSKEKSGIFLDGNLKPDTSIKLKEKYFLIAEYGSFTADERGNSLVVLDSGLTQLQEPFPFEVPVFFDAFIKPVALLDSKFYKFYEDAAFKLKLHGRNVKALKKSPPPKSQ